MASPNQSIFRNLAGQMPGQNQQVVTGLQEAAKSQMLGQIGAQGPMGQPMGVRQVQQAGAQATAMQAQPLLQVQEQAQKQAGQLGQMALKEEANLAQAKLQERQLNQTKQQRAMESQLNQLNSGLKQRLLDDQLTFQKDELGRTFFNERQLLDYKLANAKSNIELRDFEQKMRQASQRKLQLLKAAQAKINQELSQTFAQGQQELDQAQTKRLAEAKRAMDEKIRREQARARNRGSMFSALGTLAGMGIVAASGGSAALILAGGMGGQGVGSILQNTKL
jgi:hypothetical protein